jgi:hypothetical protein
MKTLIVLTSLIFVINAFACPMLKQDKPLQLIELKEFVSRLDNLSENKKINKAILKCSEKNKQVISWEQTKFLIGSFKLMNYYSGRFTRSKLSNKLLKNYYKLHKDNLFVDTAVELAKSLSTAKKTNKMIERFFEYSLKRNTINYEHLNILTNGLESIGTYQNSDSLHGITRTTTRVFKKFIRKYQTEITPQQLVSMTNSYRKSRKSNKHIFSYFKKNIKSLTWDETTYLMSNLAYSMYQSSTGQGTRIKNRMTLLWNEAQ